jgi:hypothetical protein
MEIAMAEVCRVDVELFDNLAQAIAFVAECGGGVVHTGLANSVVVRGMKLPEHVRLEPPRLRPDPAIAA